MIGNVTSAKQPSNSIVVENIHTNPFSVVLNTAWNRVERDDWSSIKIVFNQTTSNPSLLTNEQN